MSKTRTSSKNQFDPNNGAPMCGCLRPQHRKDIWLAHLRRRNSIGLALLWQGTTTTQVLGSNATYKPEFRPNACVRLSKYKNLVYLAQMSGNKQEGLSGGLRESHRTSPSQNATLARLPEQCQVHRLFGYFLCPNLDIERNLVRPRTIRMAVALIA